MPKLDSLCRCSHSFHELCLVVRGLGEYTPNGHNILLHHLDSLLCQCANRNCIGDRGDMMHECGCFLEQLERLIGGYSLYTLNRTLTSRFAKIRELRILRFS